MDSNFAIDQENALLVRDFSRNIIGKVIYSKEKHCEIPTKKRVLAVIDNLNSFTELKLKKTESLKRDYRDFNFVNQENQKKNINYNEAPLSKKIKSSADKENQPSKSNFVIINKKL